MLGDIQVAKTPLHSCINTSNQDFGLARNKAA